MNAVRRLTGTNSGTISEPWRISSPFRVSAGHQRGFGYAPKRRSAASAEKTILHGIMHQGREKGLNTLMAACSS